MVIHDKFIYIHMPKTGGTFVSYYLQDNILGSNYFGPGYGHQSVSSQRLNYPKHFMFGTIRNPWDWYVSTYEFDKNGGNYSKQIKECGYDFNKFVTYLLTNTEGAISRMRFNISSELDIGMCTYQYILLFNENPQAVYQKKNKEWDKGIDKTVRIEDIKTELPEMFKKYIFELSEKQIDSLIKMEKMNTTSRDGKHYRDYYTEETKHLVYKKDKLIIERYNYSF